MPIRIKVTVAILIALVLFALIGPFLVPIPELTDTVPARQLADPDSRFANVNGINVHYKQRGDGDPAFVLLHGSGLSAFSWRELLEPLGSQGTAVAFDLPAFGLTDRPMPGEWTGTNPYSMQGQLELTLGLMDELGLDKAVLVGHSSGGTLATQLALTHPERVSALVLVDAAVYAGGGPPAWARPLLHTPQMNRLGRLIVRQFGGEPGLNLLRAAWHDPEALSDEVLAGYRESFQVDNWDRALWEMTKANRAPMLAGRLGNLKVPTLVISGDSDQVVPLEQSRRLAQDIPGAELSVLEECGHVPQEECPAATLEAIRAWLEQEALPN